MGGRLTCPCALDDGPAGQGLGPVRGRRTDHANRATIRAETGSGTKALPSFRGDRILVAKFSYQFSEPERWTWPCSSFPRKPRPISSSGWWPANEVLEIHHGDIFTCTLPEQYGKHADSQLRLLDPELKKLPKTIAAKTAPRNSWLCSSRSTTTTTCCGDHPAGLACPLATLAFGRRQFRECVDHLERLPVVSDRRPRGRRGLVALPAPRPRQWQRLDDDTLMPAGSPATTDLGLLRLQHRRVANKPDPIPTPPDSTGWAICRAVYAGGPLGFRPGRLRAGRGRLADGVRIDVATGEATLSIDHEDAPGTPRGRSRGEAIC